MYTANLDKIGDAVVLTVPPAILDSLHLQAGEKVELRVDEDRLVIQPHPRPRYKPDGVMSGDRWQQFVYETAGSIPDPAFQRHPQGEFEQRDELFTGSSLREGNVRD